MDNQNSVPFWSQVGLKRNIKGAGPKSKFSSSIYRYAVVSRESSVFIMGGHWGSSQSPRIAKYTIDKWELVGSLQDNRYGPRAILNGDRMYVVGGEFTRS